MRVTVKHSGKRLDLSIEDDAIILDLKNAIHDAVGIPVDQQKLLSSGKQCDDLSALVSVVAPKLQLMLIRSAARPALRVTLRDPVRGRCVRHVPAAGLLAIRSLCELAVSSLRLTHSQDAAGRWALYWAEGKMLLREELSVADYALPEDAELFCVHLQTAPRAVPSGSRAEAAEISVAELAMIKSLFKGDQNDLKATNDPGLDAAPELAMIKQLLAGQVGRIAGDQPPTDDDQLQGTRVTPETATLVPTTMRSGLLGPAMPSREIPVAALLDGLEAVAAPMTQPPPEVPGAMTDAQTEWAEHRLAGLVDSLRRAEHKPAAPRPVKSQFSGLAKGFLNAPRKRRARATAAAPAVEVTETPAPEEVASFVAARAGEAKKKGAAREMCKVCEIRLPLTACVHSVCKCGHVFCGRHLHDHTCSFDHRELHKRRLLAANPKLSASKIEGERS